MTTRTKIIVASGVFLFFAIPIAYGTYRPAVIKYISERREQKLIELSEKNAKSIEDAYRNDFDGGATPEETLELFLVALKEGNPEKASKYYELSVQPKALESLKEEFGQNGNLKLSIDYFTRVVDFGVKTCKDAVGCTLRYTISYQEDTRVPIVGTEDVLLVPKGGSLDEFIDLTLNKTTNRWKIRKPL